MTQTISISGYAFVPAKVTIKIGTTVIWTNKDSVDHTVTSSDGTWSSGNLASSASYRRTFNKAGTFNYVCAIHLQMKGTVVVTP